MRERDWDGFFQERLGRNGRALTPRDLKGDWGCFGWTGSLSFRWAMARVGLAASAQAPELGRGSRAPLSICRTRALQAHKYPSADRAAPAAGDLWHPWEQARRGRQSTLQSPALSQLRSDLSEFMVSKLP